MAQSYFRREPSPAEEMANSISHGLGLVASLAAAPILIITAMKAGGGTAIFGAAVFALSMVSLYLASTLYHVLPEARGKGIFRILDHAAIFLLIAGTYTPFTLGVMRGPWGWTLLGLIWSLAIIGLILKAVPATRYSRASIVLYVAMGWLAVIAARPILLQVPLPGILWIVSGGLAYTSGLVFFGMHRLRFNHFIWHLFVMAGTICHFFAVLWYST
ncbi:MAG: hemolysin [Acidobacteria bacterium]|nr:hemolysin [Acidobacteriota bacterium]